MKSMSVGALFFLCALVPTFINFAKGGHYYIASDRYAYLPSIGLLIIITALLARVLGGRSSSTKNGIAATIGGVLLVLLGVQTTVQASYWKNSETLFTRALALYPNAAVAHNNLGSYYVLQKKYDEAIASFEASIKQIERSPQPSDATIYANAAEAYKKKGQLSKAEEYFEEALNLDAKNPQALTGLATVYDARGEDVLAEEYYQQALSTDPAYLHAHMQWGNFHMLRKQYNNAAERFSLAAESSRLTPEPYYNLAVALTHTGRYDEAIDAYKRAIALDPKNTAARINLGLLYSQHQMNKEAKQQFEAILQYDPDNRSARSAVGQL